MTRTATAILIAALAAGCAAKTGSDKLIVTPAPEKSAPPALPRAFPGRPLGSLALRSSELVQSSARVLLSSADGSLSLIAGRSRTNRLCAGAGSPLSGETAVRCLAPGERPPLIGFIAMAGRRVPGANEIDSSSVVGLADPSTARVVLVLQDLSRRSVKLRRLPGLPWRVFSTGPYENRAADSESLIGLPSALIALDGDGAELSRVELSYGYPHCRPDLCAYKQTKAGDWVIVRDPIASQQSPQISPAREQQAKRLLLSNASVRRIVSGRQYSLGALGYWQKCNGESIGVIADVLLTYPISIKGTLPYTTYENGTGSAYLEGRASFDADNVRGFSVNIDLNRKRVVSISINPTIGDDVAVRSIRQVGKFHPAGGHDTANCGSEGD